ncbi:MAG TPA: hypothetical protein VHZ75_03010 [Solirubrobacteraceae bacterium]|jgi:hypothetical protein|nr:hypothetical protein [Solirubrobacteraceae bacterium]
MSVSAVSARPARLLKGFALCAALLASMLAFSSPASAATVKAKVKVNVSTVGLQDTLLGTYVTVHGVISAVVPNATVDLSHHKIKVRINGGDVLCISTTNVDGTFTCHAFVNSLVRKTLKKVGIAVGFVGETVACVVHGVLESVVLPDVNLTIKAFVNL